jgi:hypothetical protein
MKTLVKDIISIKEKELQKLSNVYFNYPDARVEFSPLGNIFVTDEANKIVNCLEEIIPNEKYAFYFLRNGIKMYADPYSITVKTGVGDGYELEWLSEVICINPAILVQLMEKINSRYITNLYFYQKRYPQLKKWISAYAKNVSPQDLARYSAEYSDPVLTVGLPASPPAQKSKKKAKK